MERWTDRQADQNKALRNIGYVSNQNIATTTTIKKKLHGLDSQKNAFTCIALSVIEMKQKSTVQSNMTRGIHPIHL